VTAADIRFACPACASDLEAPAEDRRRCASCGSTYVRRDAVWRFLTPDRAAALEPFVRQYRAVRDRDGHRRPSPPEFYRLLPNVGRDDPHAAEWLVRRETYHHLLRHVLASGPQPGRVLDLGAGTAWLSHRLAALGHLVVAVDIIDDELDGLGASRHYAAPFVAVQADFDALPFAPAQFDLVVFNGSLHYAHDAAATLAGAHRMLAAGGALVVMDSPFFAAAEAGAAMVDEKFRRFAADLGVAGTLRGGDGYLTFARLRAVADALDLQPQFVPSRGSWLWRMKRQIGRLRLGRAPAAFGLWVAR